MSNNVIRFPSPISMKEALKEIAETYGEQFEAFVLVGTRKEHTDYVIVNTIETHRELAGAANIVTNLADAAFESLEDLDADL